MPKAIATSVSFKAGHAQLGAPATLTGAGLDPVHTKRSIIGSTAGVGGAFGSRSKKLRSLRPKRLIERPWAARVSKRTAVLAAERGASEQAIGVTRGGRNSKIHALVDTECRPGC